jgi:hypothetical protein
MEDVRMGRATAVVENKRTIAVTSTPFVDYDKDRTMLTFWPPPSGTLTLSILNPAVANQGITLVSTGVPIVLDIKIHGQLVTKSWYGIHSVGGVVCSCHEGRLDAK